MVYEFTVEIERKGEPTRYKSLTLTADDDKALYRRILSTYSIPKEKVKITNRWEEVGTIDIKKK